MENVDAALRRNIKNGEQYNKYFANSSCTVSYLGKGNTSFHVKKMKQWAKKYAFHTKELALEQFAGKSLQETVMAIHNFLYWHIQYKMDGENQNLKSPACAWATRDQGTDCKSYSVFASTILQNLGIKHFFRKVKQPNFSPDLWSHVYVVIPKDQKKSTAASKADYFILDATVPDNKEVYFSRKQDLIMNKVSLPAYGLASPGLAGCSCTGQPSNGAISRAPRSRSVAITPNVITSPLVNRGIAGLRGLGATGQEETELEKALQKFEFFLADYVVNKGLPAATADMAKERIIKFIKLGKEPTILDLFAIPITPKRAKGLGMTIIGGIEVPVLRNINQLPSTTGIFQSPPSNGGFLSKIDPTSVASLVTAIIPKDLFDKTFGAVFANGFNFKCWGASWNPNRAEEVFVNEFNPLINQKLTQALSVQATQLEQSINNFWVDFYGVGSTQRAWLGSSAQDCTKDGLAILIGSLDGLAAQIKGIINQAITGAGHKIASSGTRSKTYPPEDTGRHSLTYNVPQYRVTLGSLTPVTTTNSFVDSNGTLKLDDPPKNSNLSTASIGWVAGGVMAAIAIGAVVTGKNPIELVKK